MMRKTDEDAYFAACNSAEGFFSFYPQCFDAARIQHVYAVKGGPGTGKSRFLRDVAQYGERMGWQSEYIYCSSDPDSLDGVILAGESGCIALMDATAPHVYEPSHPGVREDIVNLGEFWDIDLLAEHTGEIAELNTKKSEAYRQAYRFLSCLGELTHTRDELVAPFVRRDAVTRFAERLTQELPRGNGYRVQPALIGSVGMQGVISFDTYFAKASDIFLIEDCRGSAQYLMAALGEIAVKKNLSVRVSHDPILPEKLDGIFFCDTRTAFVVANERECDAPHHRVSMRRFVQTSHMKRVRGLLNYTERMRRAMLDGATECLGRVKELHFCVEQIYMSAMNFEAKEKFTKKFCERLFPLQN